MSKLPFFYIYILPIFIYSDLYSTSESLSLSTVRSHLQGFQSGYATIAGILVGARQRPHILVKQHTTSYNCSLVCFNCLPRASLLSTYKRHISLSRSVPLLNVQYMLLPAFQSYYTLVATSANKQQWQHGGGLSFLLRHNTLQCVARHVGCKCEFQGTPHIPAVTPWVKKFCHLKPHRICWPAQSLLTTHGNHLSAYCHPQSMQLVEFFEVFKSCQLFQL